MSALHEFKAELFRTLGHPIRLKILELLRTGEKTVSEIQHDLNIEASSVSQQLAVMRRGQLVDTRKSGTNVFYSVRDPLIFDLMDIARKIFENQVANMNSLLHEEERERT
ncbi:ArsR/SmtB family transcription factor [Sulfobacillus thermosulfidooxidans]|uniref:ArsR/SmtB family transcription factor n=1 Tax=Sulfobacillus thermosulfidooxidans TaxID=28034 RepID=UPI0006B55ACC|nr:metalloregulator ArsR/SmtB family transcription factor [Sulfobacillus thermosulfidooxidans]